MVSKIFILTTFLVSVFCTYASDATIRGKVLDAETNEPIPFAHVSLGDALNVSNKNGDFVIHVDQVQEKVLLKVSFIGYAPYKEWISTKQEYHKILLEPKPIELGEVEVRSDSGERIMHETFNRFYLNYEISRQHLVAYYKESLREHNKLKYLAEGIMDIYLPIDIDKEYQPLVSPIKSRKKTLEDIPEADLLTGHAGDMAQSSIWRKESFLSKKERKNYTFSYAGFTEMDGHDVFIIEFKPNSNKGDTRGKIYVQEDTYAILKLQYYPQIENNSHWDEVVWIEEYEPKEGIFKLFRVSFQGHFANSDEWYHAVLLINKSEVIDSFPDKDYIGHQDLFFERASESFTDDFWEDYNFIKLDIESQQGIGLN